jgi:hypothetical protein
LRNCNEDLSDEARICESLDKALCVLLARKSLVCEQRQHLRLKMLSSCHGQNLSVVELEVRSNAAHFSENLLKHLQVRGITSSEL